MNRLSVPIPHRDSFAEKCALTTLFHIDPIHELSVYGDTFKDFMTLLISSEFSVGEMKILKWDCGSVGEGVLNGSAFG